MLLLVTNRRDITTDYVVAELTRRGSSFFRLNTEQLPVSGCTISYERSAWSVSVGGKTICGDQVLSAYFRRPAAPCVPASVTQTGERAYIEAEWSSFLKSLYMRLEGKWLNDPTCIYLAEDKPRQLMLAHEIGFNIPPGAVTNDITSVQRIADLGQAIVKPLRQALLAGEQERVMFTTRLAAFDSSDAESVSLAPFIVQSEIAPKKYDVRVTVVGDRVFSTAIWSQAHGETEVDWRCGSRTDLRHERIELPPATQRQCLALMARLNLQYGAIDFVCDLEDTLWFLEINPNGQWAWIENLTGYPIAAAIVDKLESIARATSI